MEEFVFFKNLTRQYVISEGFLRAGYDSVSKASTDSVASDHLGGFSGGLDSPLESIRDPRENTGPVVFPPAPPDNGESSGVIVGASGYGFVPPHSEHFFTLI
ncbi:hypothetical protein NQ318_003182 [Aromia moschata]|uniref:Uncharacterized protein n=1 Tax=Aromia moschata TaxID=1265417 RepID=A0AAV8YFK0_9CUCU|nr:hypothetical protein NQ318_003182 [Aromia moschata]